MKAINELNLLIFKIPKHQVQLMRMFHRETINKRYGRDELINYKARIRDY